jgi:hypothetical protein
MAVEVMEAYLRHAFSNHWRNKPQTSLEVLSECALPIDLADNAFMGSVHDLQGLATIHRQCTAVRGSFPYRLSEMLFAQSMNVLETYLKVGIIFSAKPA